jgi:adenylosuccinate lyase
MNTHTLMSLSPLDGRYADKLSALRPFCSEFALIKQRVLVEVRWLQLLCGEAKLGDLPSLSPTAIVFLEAIVSNFSIEDALAIKTIEKTTNHDVKAVEYFLKDKVQGEAQLKEVSEFIHFACTSEDINNLAYGLMLSEARIQVILPEAIKIISALTTLATAEAAQSMLARTHGQVASPTTLGKEILNVVKRLERQYAQIEKVAIMGKLNGAVGNFNAHFAAYPEMDWLSLSEQFVQSLGLNWQSHTTQIEPHDYIAELFDAVARFNTILIDFARDVWGYISVGYFTQKVLAHETGSSTMPHKVNPIDFENAEGNLAMANAVLDFLSRRLPVSRWQRDLVDSTLLRNIGVGLGHSFLAYQSLLRGISKLAVNREKIDHDLNTNWEVLGEAIQTVMRRYHIEQPYEKLKALTRGKTINAVDLTKFVESLELPSSVKTDLLKLTPANYIGNAVEQVNTKVALPK